jgi:hypothetical protein
MIINNNPNLHIYDYKLENFKSFRKEMIINAGLTKNQFNNTNVFLDKMIFKIDKEGLFYDFKDTYKNYLISFR